jgi:hypothetical protein
VETNQGGGGSGGARGWAPGERRLGEGNATRNWVVGFQEDIYIPGIQLVARPIDLDKSGLSPTSQLADRQVQLVVSLQCVDIRVATLDFSCDKSRLVERHLIVALMLVGVQYHQSLSLRFPAIFLHLL